MRQSNKYYYISRNLVTDWSELSKWVEKGKFSVKRAYMDRIADNPKPSSRALWSNNNKASPRVSFACGRFFITDCRLRLGLLNGGSLVILVVFYANLRWRMGIISFIDVVSFRRSIIIFLIKFSFLGFLPLRTRCT